MKKIVAIVLVINFILGYNTIVSATAYGSPQPSSSTEETIQEPLENPHSQGSESANHTPDEIISEAENFLNKATSTLTINGDNLAGASSTLYNILLSIGIFLAIAIGMYLGVKFMMATAEDRAKVKEALIPYIVGCVIIFTAFTIWRIVIILLNGIA